MKKMDIKRTIIDVHAHILPGVDDGSRSMEESFRMLERAAAQGLTAVIATPHYSRRRKPEEYMELAAKLQQHIREKIPDMKIYLGQETYYHEELDESLRSGKALSMNGSRYVLAEFDPGAPYQTLFRGLRKLILAGYVPVLAHMDRYLCLRQEINLDDLAGSGCIFQMNYESLEGKWLQKDVRWCRRQVGQGRIQLLGTDMHRMDYRPPQIDGAWKWLESHVSETMLRAMTYDNPMRLIQDKKIN